MKSNLRRTSYLITASLLISGCVGFEVKTKKQEAVSFDNFQGFSTLQDGQRTCCYLRHKIQNGADITISTAKLLKEWGEPAEVINSGQSEVWVYPDRKSTWSGFVVYAVIPIPFLIPTAQGIYRIHVKNNSVTKIEMTTNSANGFACSPLLLPADGEDSWFCRSGKDILW